MMSRKSKLNEKQMKKMVEKNHEYLQGLRQNQPSLRDELVMIIQHPKQLTDKGLQELVKALKKEHGDVNFSDDNTKALVSTVFSLGIDEGVREALFRVTRHQTHNESPKPTKDNS